MTESVFTIQEEETNRKLSFDQNGRTEYTVEFNGKDHGVLPLKMLKHLKEDMWWYENDLARINDRSRLVYTIDQHKKHGIVAIHECPTERECMLPLAKHKVTVEHVLKSDDVVSIKFQRHRFALYGQPSERKDTYTLESGTAGLKVQRFDPGKKAYAEIASSTSFSNTAPWSGHRVTVKESEAAVVTFIAVLHLVLNGKIPESESEGVEGSSRGAAADVGSGAGFPIERLSRK